MMKVKCLKSIKVKGDEKGFIKGKTYDSMMMAFNEYPFYRLFVKSDTTSISIPDEQVKEYFKFIKEVENV